MQSQLPERVSPSSSPGPQLPMYQPYPGPQGFQVQGPQGYQVQGPQGYQVYSAYPPQPFIYNPYVNPINSIALQQIQPQNSSNQRLTNRIRPLSPEAEDDRSSKKPRNSNGENKNLTENEEKLKKKYNALKLEHIKLKEKQKDFKEKAATFKKEVEAKVTDQDKKIDLLMQKLSEFEKEKLRINNISEFSSTISKVLFEFRGRLNINTEELKKLNEQLDELKEAIQKIGNVYELLRLTVEKNLKTADNCIARQIQLEPIITHHQTMISELSKQIEKLEKK